MYQLTAIQFEARRLFWNSRADFIFACVTPERWRDHSVETLFAAANVAREAYANSLPPEDETYHDELNRFWKEALDHYAKHKPDFDISAKLDACNS